MEPIQRDPLFVAATRPALFLGLPIEMAVALIMLAGFIMIFGHNPLYEAVLGPLWVGSNLLVRYDYNGPRVAWLWFLTKARGFRETQLWGGASPSPFPIKTRKGRGVADAR